MMPGQSGTCLTHNPFEFAKSPETFSGSYLGNCCPCYQLPCQKSGDFLSGSICRLFELNLLQILYFNYREPLLLSQLGKSDRPITEVFILVDHSRDALMQRPYKVLVMVMQFIHLKTAINIYRLQTDRPQNRVLVSSATTKQLPQLPRGTKVTILSQTKSDIPINKPFITKPS